MQIALTAVLCVVTHVALAVLTFTATYYIHGGFRPKRNCIRWLLVWFTDKNVEVSVLVTTVVGSIMFYTVAKAVDTLLPLEALPLIVIYIITFGALPMLIFYVLAYGTLLWELAIEAEKRAWQK